MSTMRQPANHQLAQLNIGRIRYEIDDPRMADFTNNLALVNGLAERTPGFVWRYIDESGNSTSTRPYADPRIAINLSVWESVEALERFVYQTLHKRFHGRRAERPAEQILRPHRQLSTRFKLIIVRPQNGLFV